ncbi:MAG: type I restriction endonuclease [Luteolibacter sp.]|nr:type I restriction endonuclease [Luteolibacter sp.]
MPSQTNESALEACIERHLTGGVSAMPWPGVPFGDDVTPYQTSKGAGYLRGKSTDFNTEFAIDETRFWQFLESTQAPELAKLHYKADWKRQVLERLHRKLKKDGILAVLKKGLDVDNAHLTLFYRLPYNDLNPDVTAKFESNVFSVTRQVYFSKTDHKSVDMVVFLNGLPLATLELKNPWTGQNVNHAKKQYREDRDPKETLFQFRRCLVHFAVDPDEVWMTTKLDGKGTYFLPFNKGLLNGQGKGNPVNPDGHKTAYLWQDILTRHSLSNIIEHFAKVTEEKDKKTKQVRQTLYFPRYHQLDVVRKILADLKKKGIGLRYLIQHSAGSGKSNSIAWLAYQLIELYDAGGENNLFDSVIVVTDRRVLDRQLDRSIRQFSEFKNLLAHADSAADLRSHLEKCKKLITTTIQKFPFIVDGIADMSDRKFAVIIDEAHSSQGGQAADKLNMTIGATDEDEEPEDYQEKILQAMERRKMGKNASYFAFTATPKKATLEKFGVRNAEGGFDPFDLYSMKQAIEENFILDVLANYTTYKSYYEVRKSIEDNPEFDTIKAQKKLRSYVESHQQTIDAKAAMMVDHFNLQVVGTKKLRGQARGMVVTRNIESAIRYFFAIRNELKKVNAPFQAIIAFSGSKKVDGIDYTEDSINGFPSKDIPDKFKEPGYRILVVANKFLTGFDEPLLHTMYVDKRLQGVLAVQTLSRLNRSNEKMQKQDTFVLDFYNSAAEIKSAFDDFYTSTSLTEPTDINILHDIKDALDDVAIYEDEDIETFNELFFNGVDAEQLHPIIDETVSRFDLIEDENDKIDFKIKAKQFVKLYGQLACIMPFPVSAWEKLHWFLKFLIPKLKVKDKDKDQLDALLESVDLSTYALQRVRLNEQIALDAAATELEPDNEHVHGVHEPGEDESPLDEIIRHFNERWFSAWPATPEEQRIKLVKLLEHVQHSAAYTEQVEGNPDEQNRDLALRSLIGSAVNKERKKDLELYKLYAGDPDFRKSLEESLIRILALHEKSKPA